MIKLAFVRQVGLLRWAMRYGYIQLRRRVLRRDTRMTLPTGGVIVLPRYSPSATEVFVTGASIDWGSEQLFLEHVDPTSDFLDVGAHIGYYAAYLAPRVRHVYAFEPDPRNLPAIEANARLASNITVVPSAVSSREGRATLFTGGGTAENTLESRRGGPSIEVAVTSIDAFVARHPSAKVGAIKIDTEGHDLEALASGRSTIARDAPLILTECTYSAELERLLAEWGYASFAFVRDRGTMRTSFQPVHGSTADRLWYKMLFLVPPRLRPQFERRVDRGAR